MALSENNPEFREFLELTNDFVLRLDETGVVRFANGKVRGILGLTSEECVGRPFTDFLYEEDREYFEAKFRDWLEKRAETPRIHNRLIGPSGGRVYMNWSFRLSFDESGRCTDVFAFGKDYTWSKKAEDQLARVMNFAGSFAEGIAIADWDGTITYANRSWAVMHGYEDSYSLIGKNLRIFHTEEQMEKDVLPFNRRVAEKGVCRGEVGHRMQDGRLFLTEMTTTLVRSERGDPARLIAFARNITRERDMENALKHRLVLERALSDFTTMLLAEEEPDMNRVLRILGEAVSADRAFYFHYRADEEQVDNTVEWCADGIHAVMNDYQGLNAPDYPWIQNEILHRRNVIINGPEDLPEEAALEREIFKRENLQSLALIPAYASGEFLGFIGFDCLRRRKEWSEEDQKLIRTAADILATYMVRQRATEALRTGERFLSNIFEGIQDGMCVMGRDYRVIRVNSTLERMYGHTSPLEGRLCHEVFHGRSKRCEICPVAETFATGKTAREIVRKVGAGGKEEGWIDLYSFPILDQVSGELTGVIEYVRDITDRVRAEEALKDSEERYRRLVELSPNAIFIHSQGRLTFVNAYGAEMVGAESPEDILGRPLADFVHPDSREAVMHRVKNMMDAGRPVPAMEERFLRLDGRAIEVEVWATPFSDKGEPAVIGVARDISGEKRGELERRNLEAQLRHQQKLESIGTLASGVAHEINNPINSIMNYADLISSKKGQDSMTAEFADEISNECERIAKIVKNLLAFARQEKETHSPASMHDIVSRSVSLFRTALRKNQIKLEWNVPEDLPKIKCRSQQIQQVLVNLIVNARDALNERYEGYHEDKLIRIQAEPIEIEGRDYIRTTVEDHGAGIPEEMQDRIFDPFFTTKSRDIGTGLGLSVSHGIVKEHKGELSVESVVNRYTRFHMDIPMDNGWKILRGEEKG